MIAHPHPSLFCRMLRVGRADFEQRRVDSVCYRAIGEGERGARLVSCDRRHRHWTAQISGF
ncbi:MULTISPECIES: hypothetical protein [Rhodopseudomonas]|nr:MULTISPECIES: hypothetical protein [Rhodopseudomonas]MDF3810823.1 hypothetical protein [Rhodopseudomonas sp. BAL398]WOK17281.1 hypothetical protein RBJ75_24670 [Rhodopseudomonas sp. BAL398]